MKVMNIHAHYFAPNNRQEEYRHYNQQQQQQQQQKSIDNIYQKFYTRIIGVNKDNYEGLFKGIHI